MHSDLDVPQPAESSLHWHCLDISNSLETFLIIFAIISFIVHVRRRDSACRAVLLLLLLTELKACVAHVRWNIGHWQSEAVAHVGDLQLLVAVGSQDSL